MPASAFAKALDSKTGLISVVAVGGVIVLGVLWMLRRGLGDLFGGASETVGAVGDILRDTATGAAAITGGASDLVKSTIDTSRNVLEPTRQLFDPPSVQDRLVYKDDQPTLKLKVLRKKGGGGSGFLNMKENDVVVLVTDQAGNPVAGATVEFFLTHPLVAWTTKNNRNLTDNRGQAAIGWTVRDIAGTSSEDDAQLIASKNGYNSSNTILVR